MAIPLILIAPDLLGRSEQALAKVRSLATLADISAAPRVHRNGLAAALLASLGTPAETPVAPLAADGAGVEIGGQYVVVADPVLLAADRDNVVLMTRIDDLREDESKMLLATLNQHFAEDGVRFVAPRADAWFTLMPNGSPIRLASTDVVQGRGIFAFVPKGDEARVWRRWQNEIQMLLHEHPVNTAREERGALPVTGLWFWGGGTSAEVDRLPPILAVSEGSRFCDLLTGITHRAGGMLFAAKRDDDLQRVLEYFEQQRRSGTFIVVAVERIASDEALTAFESRWLQPALRLLMSESIGSLHLLANGGGDAAEWHAMRPSWWQRLLPRTKGRSFVSPATGTT